MCSSLVSFFYQSIMIPYEILINCLWIVELDVRTWLDSREYFEVRSCQPPTQQLFCSLITIDHLSPTPQIPAFLLTTLIYAFWLSFSRIGSKTVNPTVWPLLWLALTTFIIINPLPIWSKSSRWWFLKKVGRLLISGTRRVEVCHRIYSTSQLTGCVSVVYGFLDGVCPTSLEL